jgi:hypothetical protein
MLMLMPMPTVMQMPGDDLVPCRAVRRWMPVPEAGCTCLPRSATQQTQQTQQTNETAETTEWHHYGAEHHIRKQSAK